MKKTKIIAIAIVSTILLCRSSLTMAQQTSPIFIIPQPVSIEMGKGEFELTANTAIEVMTGDTAVMNVAAYLAAALSRPTGYRLQVNKVAAFGKGNIHLQYSPTSSRNAEAYRINTSPDGLTISADSSAGLFYATQTVIQLFPNEIYSTGAVQNIKWKTPSVIITDHPRFKWRGTMLDVARHFFTKQQVKDFIDNMVRYKFNVLHLHLSDDQGWRLEIKSLPKLTDVGAWRAERLGKWGNTTRPLASEPKTYGGFYTHDDIREIIAYAKSRYVEILPEIDVPGHSLAAVASYPELSCTDSVYHVSVGDKIMQWHSKGFSALIDNTLCPANEKVYEFLDKVFDEVAQLFPFGYIHMGGDECAKDFWLKSTTIKNLMRKEDLKNMNEVQGYFVKRVEKIIRSKGKKMIGWDEILDDEIPSDAAVMSWRGMKGGIKAAKLGYKVVMSPATHSYYDLYQGDPLAEPPTYSMVRLRDAYKFDPVPEGVDEKLILGGQGNLWTEQIQNMRHAQYMMFPRVLAVAESVWSPAPTKNWKSFIGKVENEFVRLDHAEIKYSRSMYDPIVKTSSEKGLIKLDLETEIDGLEIYYSYDGSIPDNYYPKYTKPLLVPKDVADVKIVTYQNGRQVGKQIVLPVVELSKRVKK